MDNPRVIYEFEGGPTSLYWVNPLLFGPEYKSNGMKSIVLEACKYHEIFRKLQVTPILEAVKWDKVELFKECEECDECNKETCPKPAEEVMEKGSGVKKVETLEGWFIEFSNCYRWKECPHCKGEGYFKNP